MKNISILLTFILLPLLLSAWGPNGHRVVAQICYNNLNDEAKKVVDEALGDDYLTQVANWPDYIKSEKNWSFANPWHYVSMGPYKTMALAIEAAEKDPEINNVVEGIHLMQAILKGDDDAIKTFQSLMDENGVEPLSGSIKATAFAFLIHFIGDIHQPMHVSKNNDFGGNKIKVLFFSEETNLHAVWDGGIVEKEKLSFTEFSSFVEKHTHSLKAECENDSIDQWVEESVMIREDIYNTLYDFTDRETGLPTFTYNYQHDFLPVVERRLGMAGYRSAAMINAIFN